MAMDLSRRSFLGMTGLAAVSAAVLSGCSQSSSTSASTASSDSTADTSDSALTMGSASDSSVNSLVDSFYTHVKSVTSLAKTYPAGEKIVGVAIQYDSDVDASSLSAGGGGVNQQAGQMGLGTYFVLGRSITNVYVSNAAALGDQGLSSGPYVIVELDPTDAGAQTMMFQMTRGYVGSNGPVNLDSGVVRLCQVADAKTSSGDTLSGDATQSRYLVASSVSNSVVDSFVDGAFDDPSTGYHADFEFRVPDGYDSSKSYPLVLFLPDAGVKTNDPKVSLRQGLGAVSWEENGCFILTVADTCVDIPTCLDLIDQLSQKYSIDQNRIYGTGESAGCMALIAYGADHPTDSRFAGLMLVSGQGNMTPIASTPMVIFVSEDDQSSYGGMSDANSGVASIGVPYVETQLDLTYDFDGEGHTSGRWVDYVATGQKNPSGNQEGAKLANSTRTLDQLMEDLSSECSAACQKADAEGAHIVYFHIAEGTLDGTDRSIMGGNTHNFTWQYAYNIPELREWIISQQ